MNNAEAGKAKVKKWNLLGGFGVMIEKACCRHLRKRRLNYSSKTLICFGSFPPKFIQEQT